MKTLQIGMEWFGDRPGGLDRYYYDCYKYLPQANISMPGLLAGLDRVIQESKKLISQSRCFAQGFSPSTNPIWSTMPANIPK